MATETEGEPPRGPETEGAVLLDADKKLAQAAVELGIFCSNCEQELPHHDPPGYEYMNLIPAVDSQGHGGVRAERDVICSRTECAPAKSLADRTAMFRRRIPLGQLWEAIEPPAAGSENGASSEEAEPEVKPDPRREACNAPNHSEMAGKRWCTFQEGHEGAHSWEVHR